MGPNGHDDRTTNQDHHEPAAKPRQHSKNSVIDSLVTGAISSVATTIVYQPLELLKTRIQIQDAVKRNGAPRVFGRATLSALRLVQHQGLGSLWKGTGASLARSGPGVGLYYALLNVLQSNFSNQNNRPDNATQAFYFGLTARSMVSLALLPITVVKVRYESGQFQYPSLAHALKNAYFNSNGWVGVAPTVLRDSLFSGIYYMCYTELRARQQDGTSTIKNRANKQEHLRNFANGIVSGIVASVVTNPIDVIKTNMQVATSAPTTRVSTLQVTRHLLSGQHGGGYLRLFDGLVPRSVRRTLIAASTWTFYELMIETVVHSRG